eukprot:m.245587 g.245587  ORF g.245587 m.245587 type:complete len:313 (-) comp19052_c0_seq26:329-1267(-)
MADLDMDLDMDLNWGLQSPGAVQPWPPPLQPEPTGVQPMVTQTNQPMSGQRAFQMLDHLDVDVSSPLPSCSIFECFLDSVDSVFGASADGGPATDAGVSNRRGWHAAVRPPSRGANGLGWHGVAAVGSPSHRANGRGANGRGWHAAIPSRGANGRGWHAVAPSHRVNGRGNADRQHPRRATASKPTDFGRPGTRPLPDGGPAASSDTRRRCCCQGGPRALAGPVPRLALPARPPTHAEAPTGPAVQSCHDHLVRQPLPRLPMRSGRCHSAGLPPQDLPQLHGELGTAAALLPRVRRPGEAWQFCFLLPACPC